MDFSHIRKQLHETGPAIKAAYELGRSLDSKTACALATLLWDIETAIAEVIDYVDEQEVLAVLDRLIEDLSALGSKPPAPRVSVRRCSHFALNFPRRPWRVRCGCRERPSGRAR